MATRQSDVYSRCTPVVDSRYDRDDDRSLSSAIVKAVARAEGTDPTDLPPLYEDIDLEALAMLFEGPDGDVDPDAIFRFSVDSWCVFVRGDGRIRVCDATNPTDPEPVFER